MISDVSTSALEVDPHSHHSMLRERILEHVFVGELLRLLWRKQIWDVEVLRSEFDAYGYDMVLSRGGLVRHVQLKTKQEAGAAREAKLALSLADKPSGCVISMVVNQELEISHFLWFGGRPGEPLPAITHMKVAKHTKGNAAGVKLGRENHRLVAYSRFERVPDFPGLLRKLFDLA